MPTTQGTYYAIETTLKDNQSVEVELPPALRALGSCTLTNGTSSVGPVPQCTIRWAGQGDLSSYREVLLEGTDVLGAMRGKGGKGATTVMKNYVSKSTATLHVMLVETEEEKTRMDRALSASTLHTSSHHSNDVRLYFPRQERELWTSSALLSAKSPYFKTLLSSSFSEGVKKTTYSSMTTDSSVAHQNKSGFDDSDDERDEALPKGGDTLASQGEEDCSHPFHEITVRETAFTTYRAVLGWLNTSYIDFAELSSSTSSAAQPPAEVKRANAASSSSTTSSSLLSPPSPTSPLSVYRLSHFLSLSDLSDLALSSLASQLTIQNILPHLFSPTTSAYPEIADVVVEFAARNWSAIRESEEAREVEREIESGGRCLDTGVAWRLMQRFE